MEPQKPNFRVIVKSLNLYNRLCTLLSKDMFKISYDTFSPYGVYADNGKTFMVDTEGTFHNLADNEIYPYIVGKFGLKASICKHDIIDNGTRVSECRKCSMRMELKGWDWTESPVKEAVQETTPTPTVKKSKKQEYLDNMRLLYARIGYTGEQLERAVKVASDAYDKNVAQRKAHKQASLASAYGGKLPPSYSTK